MLGLAKQGLIGAASAALTMELMGDQHDSWPGTALVLQTGKEGADLVPEIRRLVAFSR